MLRSRHEPRQRERWTQRLGFFSGHSELRRPLWIHAVSVGESMAAAPLVKEIKERFPALDILVTNTTLTGSDTVTRLFSDEISQVYFPYDLPITVGRFLDHFEPRMLLLLETELWPNTLSACERRGIPVFLANGRLSESSMQSYQRVASLSRFMVQRLSCVAAQSAADAERFSQLGASEECLHVTGSLKFDLDLPPSLFEQAAALRRQLDVNRPVVMFGSTREGEEAIVLDALSELFATFDNLLAIIAPRHPERFGEAIQLCRQAGLRVCTHNHLSQLSPNDNVLVVDQMGELTRYYAASDVTFVGGSLLPFGGHNVLEPAALGKPVLSGPHTYNFSEIGRMLCAEGAMIEVTDAIDLARAVRVWLNDSNERDRVGRIGQELVRRHGGATRQTVDLLANLMVEQ